MGRAIFTSDLSNYHACHLQAFPGHRGPVSCLTFRQMSSELFSGSFDRTIKIWNAEDRAYINTLFGHQNEVLTIDSLRKERVLTVGRDRTMHLWKVSKNYSHGNTYSASFVCRILKPSFVGLLRNSLGSMNADTIRDGHGDMKIKKN